MKDLEWQQIEAIFEAIEKEPDESTWPVILDRLCGDDAKLRDRAERLLQANREASGFLEGSAPIPEAPSAYRRFAAGEQLGPYRILRQIGEGGMGTVFLAERSDGSFDLEVAIKVLRHGTEGKAAIEQFERERQILANLQHPCIARLLDGGTTETGLPYVVMEYVVGEPIDEACDRRGLSVPARVDLMLEVCEAVTAAHRALVVHRDLKPSNILISSDGKPKLLDFGIAKPLGSEDLEHPSSPTASHARRLTPSYASPEQLRGDPVTVATDVYLLGLVLYELLTQKTPFHFPRLSLLEIERTVTHETPKRPSEIAAGLDADLDAIVLKTLRGEPRDRYGSVEALAEDLQRYRRGLPVQAREGTLRYAAGKALRRHWLPLTVGLLFISMLGAFSISTALQAREQQRTLSRLTAVHGFLLELFAGADPERAKGREITLAEILHRGERQLELGQVQEAGTRSMLHAVFGRLALHTGRLSEAQEHLEHAISSGQGEDSAAAISHAQALSDLALALLYRGDDAAEPKALKALAMGRELSEPPPLLMLELLNTVATVYCRQDQWQKARPLVEEARALTEASGNPSGRQAAVTLSLSALLFKNLDQNPRLAHQAYTSSLAIYRRLEGEVHPDIANILNQLGSIDAEQGRLDEALDRHRQALEMRRRLYPDGHWEVAQSLFHLAILQWRTGDLSAAEAFMHEAWSFYDQDPGMGPSYGRTTFLWIQLAEIRLALGRVDEVEAMLDQLTPEWWQSRKPTSRLLPLARRATGCVAVARGRHAEAETLLSQSLDVLRQHHDEEAWGVQLALSCLERAR